MNKQISFSLLVVAISITFIQSCELERIEPPCPTINSLSPSAAQFDDTISIQGSNFIPGRADLYKISIGDKPVPVLDVPNESKLRFKVPKGIGDGPITISTSGTVCNTGPTFIYLLKVTDIRLLASGFNSPRGLDVDRSGNVILADKNNNRIKQIDPNNGSITNIAGNGTQGSADNDIGAFVNFNLPEDVAVDSGGTIYVADFFNHCIRKISSSSQHNVTTVAGANGTLGDNTGNTPLPSRLNRPTGLAITKTNNILTIENVKDRLCYIDFINTTMNTLLGGGASSALKFPSRVAYSEKRNSAFPILVADSNRIFEVNTNGMTNLPLTLPFQIQDLVVDETGNIIVSNIAGKVAVIYKDNSIREIAGTGINFNFTKPNGLAIDIKNKVIYISDESLSIVVRAKYE